MPKSPHNQLMLAVQDMPAEACAVLQGLAATRGWQLRHDDRAPPRVRSGEVLVAMASVWGAMAGTSRRQRPRGVLLLMPAQEPPAVHSLAAAEPAHVVLAWPCEASRLLEHLSRLMAPAPLSLDAASRTVRHRGQVVHLTPKEFRILQLLLAHAGEGVSREVLEAALHVWGQEFESNTLDVHVHRLRRKLPDAGIRAVRGYGYMLLAQRPASQRAS